MAWRALPAPEPPTESLEALAAAWRRHRFLPDPNDVLYEGLASAPLRDYPLYFRHLLEARGFFSRKMLAAPDSHARLLEAPAYYRQLLEAPAYYRQLLAMPAYYRHLLGAPDEPTPLEQLERWSRIETGILSPALHLAHGTAAPNATGANASRGRLLRSATVVRTRKAVREGDALARVPTRLAHRLARPHLSLIHI